MSMTWGAAFSHFLAHVTACQLFKQRRFKMRIDDVAGNVCHRRFKMRIDDVAGNICDRPWQAVAPALEKLKAQAAPLVSGMYGKAKPAMVGRCRLTQG